MVDSSIISTCIHQYHCFSPWLWRWSDATPSFTEHQGPRFQEGGHHARMFFDFLAQWVSRCHAWMCCSLWVTWKNRQEMVVQRAMPIHCSCGEGVISVWGGQAFCGWQLDDSLLSHRMNGNTPCYFLCEYLFKQLLPPPYHIPHGKVCM